MAVKVRFGTEEQGTFETIIDDDWGVVPRKGEFISVGSAEDPDAVYIVDKVIYVVSKNYEFIGVQVVVVREFKASTEGVR